MSWDYASRKIHLALQESKGNTARARQVLIALAKDDPKLMLALVKPHVSGIVAHAIQRYQSGEIVKNPPSDDSSAQPKATKETGDQKKPDIAKKVRKNAFGMDILKTIAGGQAVQFGHENANLPPKRTGVSQRHIDSIYTLAKRQKKK